MKKNKNTRKTLLLSVLLSAGALVGVVFIGIGVYIYSNQLKVEFFENAEVGVNETAYNDQFVKSVKNGRITTEKTPIDTSNIGKITVSLAVRSDFGPEEVSPILFLLWIVKVRKYRSQTVWKLTLEMRLIC